MPIVLGLDISYTRTGMVWITGTRDNPVVSGYKTMKFSTSPLQINRNVAKIVAEIIPNVADLAIIEGPAFGVPNKVTLAQLIELSFAFKLVLSARDIGWIVIPPSKARRDIIGKGNAKKPFVADELLRRWGIWFDSDPGHDLSDAAVLALWGLQEKCK